MMHIFRPASHEEKIEIKEHTILKFFDYLKTLNTYSYFFYNSSNCKKLNFACCPTVHCAEFPLAVTRQQRYVRIFEWHLAGVVNSSPNCVSSPA